MCPQSQHGSCSPHREGMGIFLLPSTVGAASGAASGGGAGSALLGAAGGPAGLVITGAIMGITTLIGRMKLAAQRRTASTGIVNEIEPIMRQNLAAYLGSPRTISNQSQAAANFYALWDIVVESCGVSELGQAGRRCISDRQRGGMWDWFSYYLDPIEQDPGVKPDPEMEVVTVTDPETGQPVQVMREKTGLFQTPIALPGGIELSPMVLLVGAGVVALMVMGGKS